MGPSPDPSLRDLDRGGPMRPFDPLVELPPGVTLIEASAGTGKTYNLTNLCLRLVVEHHIPIEQVLLVTFTRAATAELRDRLRDRFNEARRSFTEALQGAVPGEPVQRALAFAQGAPRADLADRLRAVERALRGIDAAPVFTIHGFCQRVLREHAFESGADLTAELLDDTSEILARVVADEHIALHYDATDLASSFYTDVCRLRHGEDSAQGGSALFTLARQITSKGRAPIEPLDDPTTTPDALARDLAEAWKAESESMLTHLRGAIGDKVVSGRSYQERWTTPRAQALDDWAANPITAPPEKALSYFSAARIAERLNKGKTYDHHPLQHTVDRFLDDWSQLADRTVAHVARRLRDRFEQALRRDGAVSFDHLIRDVADQVERPELRAALRARYQAALIDEFQDTDAEQWAIFSAVFAGTPTHRLILVGDPKQAIYAFRGADVRVYGAAKHRTPAARRFTMATNWRSDGPFVEAMNALLRTDPDPFSEPFIAYEPVGVPEAHQSPRVLLGGGRAPLTIRWFDARIAGEEPNHPIKRGEARKLLPDLVLPEVRSLLDGSSVLQTADGSRPLQAGDLAVLVRTNVEASRIRDVLVRHGIAAVVRQGEAVTRSIATSWVRAWLEVMADPSADGPLRAFAVGPLGGWSLPELSLALHHGDAKAQRRWVDLCVTLREQSGTYSDRGFWAAWQQLIGDSVLRPLDRIATAPRAERALADLAHLGELLHEASAQHRDPDALAQWLDSRAEREDLDAEVVAQRLETDTQAVQVLTIHRSKGLQYPVVLLPDLWRCSTLRSDVAYATPYDPARFDEAEPSSLRLDLSLNKDASPKSERIQVLEDDMLREAVRLAYVAITRAEHAAILWGGLTDKLGYSPLAALLAPHARASTDEQAIEIARSLDREPQLLRDAARALTTPNRIAFFEVEPLTPQASAGAITTKPVEISALAYPRGPFSRGWKRLSFTALTRDHHGPSADVTDYDEVDDPESSERSPGPAVPDQVALADFPRGREAGITIHSVLEDLDFVTGEPLPRSGAPDLASFLEQCGARLGLTDEAALASLQATLPSILQTPLGPAFHGIRLCDIPHHDRLDELEFDLPVAGGYRWQGQRGLTGAALAEVLAPAVQDLPEGEAWIQSLASMQREVVAGFLTGSLDLTARITTPDGPRWIVADYKSNRLGSPYRGAPTGASTQRDYRPERLAGAMVEHHYLLQASLYLTGLHRFLRYRLGSRYHYSTHVLGAAYLFIRGMNGEPGAGVFAYTPPAQVIHDLSDLLDEGAP
ncbi:MAG: hypothetical protein EA397_11300 [Deltaproteobacteria bacterium]|nr:MAG: hypothetical protein EA397_11300 [Deltaproteobacteria bacterium]